MLNSREILELLLKIGILRKTQLKFMHLNRVHIYMYIILVFVCNIPLKMHQLHMLCLLPQCYWLSTAEILHF